MAKVSLDNLLTENNLGEFINRYQDNENTYEVESTCPIHSNKLIDESHEKPFIEFRFMLTYLSTKQLAVVEVNERKKMTEIDYAAAGDNTQYFELAPTEAAVEEIEQYTKSVQELLTSDAAEPAEIFLVKSAPEIVSIVPEVFPRQPSVSFSDDIDETYHTFTYTLVLQSIKFSNKMAEDGVWQVSFYHPRADTPFTIVNLELRDARTESIDFGNLELDLYFSTTATNVQDLVASDQAIFNICGPHGTRGKAELNNKSLLAASKENKSGIILLENPQGENIAMANISVRLNDLGVNHNSQFKKSVVMEPTAIVKPYVDDGLAYRFVEDLEKWKKAQEEDFLVEVSQLVTFY